MSTATTAVRYIRVNVLRLSQRRLAEIAGTSQPSIARWESGQQIPDLGHLQRIREAALSSGLPWSDSWFFEVPRSIKQLKSTVT